MQTSSQQPLALGPNNIGVVVGAGAAGVPALATTALTGLGSLLFVAAGSRFGFDGGDTAAE